MKTFLQRLYVFLIYAFLYLPILVLILFSVNQAQFSLEWQGFSTRWYIELFHDSDLWIACFHSALLAVCASSFATLLGVSACIYLFLHAEQKHRTFRLLLLWLIIVPDIVLGISLLVFFSATSIPLGFFSLLIAHITFCIPFVVLVIDSRIHTIDRNLYWSALDLGASHLTAILKIMLPLLKPAVLSGLLLGFTLSFDDVVTSYFVAGPDYSILPLTIYSIVRSGATPELNALCTITFFISMILVIIAHRLSRKKS